MTEQNADHQKRFQQAVDSLTDAEDFLVIAIRGDHTEIISTSSRLIPYLIDMGVRYYDSLYAGTRFGGEDETDGHPYDDE